MTKLTAKAWPLCTCRRASSRPSQARLLLHANMRSRPSVLHGVRERDLRTLGFAVAMLIDNAWADAGDLIDGVEIVSHLPRSDGKAT
jgi:hypothetical protein